MDEYNDQLSSTTMTLERARFIWNGLPMDRMRRKSQILHMGGGLMSLSGNFTPDQLEAMAVLMRANEI